MAEKKKKDVYANQFAGSVVESAANTLTFDEIQVGLNIFDKVGLLINRIEWDINDILDETAGSGDGANLGISQSGSWTTVTLTEQSIVQVARPRRKDMGTPATAEFLDSIRVFSFADLPGGGLLVTPRPLYAFVQGVSLANPVTVPYRLYFTILDLKPEEYFELLEARQFFG